MTKPIQVVVLYFNQLSGEGRVKSLLDGSTGEIYACNIKGKKTWYPETACVFYAEGQIVDVEMRSGFVMGLTPGILDSAKWNGLDHDSLAFKCNEEGQAITGLFAKGAGL